MGILSTLRTAQLGPAQVHLTQGGELGNGVLLAVPWLVNWALFYFPTAGPHVGQAMSSLFPGPQFSPP